MFRIYFAVIIIMMFSGCSHKQPEMTKPELSRSDDNGPFAKYPIERRFALPYPEDMRLDSNSLIFYRTSAFDTSLVLHFTKVGNLVRAVCYETLPTFHRDINDYADTASHLLYFEGYSFTIDTAKWRSVKILAAGMLADTNTVFRNDGCMDCGFGMLAHDFKIRRTNNRNRSLYDDYARWLKDSILKPFVENRKPIMTKRIAQ